MNQPMTPISSRESSYWRSGRPRSVRVSSHCSLPASFALDHDDGHQRRIISTPAGWDDQPALRPSNLRQRCRPHPRWRRLLQSTSRFVLLGLLADLSARGPSHTSRPPSRLCRSYQSHERNRRSRWLLAAPVSEGGGGRREGEEGRRLGWVGRVGGWGLWFEWRERRRDVCVERRGGGDGSDVTQKHGCLSSQASLMHPSRVHLGVRPPASPPSLSPQQLTATSHRGLKKLISGNALTANVCLSETGAQGKYRN